MRPPLFGHFCCRLAIQPDSIEQSTHSGHMKISSKDTPQAIDVFARLQAFKLEIFDDQIPDSLQADKIIEINRDTILKFKEDKQINIQNMKEGNFEEDILYFETSDDAIKWNSILKKTIKEHVQWGHIAVNPTQLASPGNTKSYYGRAPRLGSLYDQVPVTNGPANRQARPTVHDIFAIPNPVIKTSPNLQEFRRRTYSSGPSRSQSNSTLSSDSMTSVNSTSSSARRSNWPLFGGDK